MATVLVVDDDHDICELLALSLEMSGYAVIVEHDGEAAMVALEQEPIDLMLLDWMMPRLGGLEVCLRVRADERFAGLPVFMLTARTQDADLRRGLAAGADRYIRKPFSPRELVGQVGSVLSGPGGGRS